MGIPENLVCVYSAEIEEEDGRAVFRVPGREVAFDTINPGGTYRIAILECDGFPKEVAPSPSETRPPEQQHPEPPVDEGDRVEVEIESIGDQGDGIARVDRGFVVIVPDTDKGERVTVAITDVDPTVAFGEVVERHHPKLD